MKRVLVRYLTILGMIAAAIWLGTTPSWEPITVLLFSLAGFIASDVTTSKEEKIKFLCCNLRENLNIAQTAKEWSTYSLEGRNLIEHTKDYMRRESYEEIRKLYPLLEATNVKIKAVQMGWWSDNSRDSYYNKIKLNIESILSSLKKERKFKKYLK